MSQLTLLDPEPRYSIRRKADGLWWTSTTWSPDPKRASGLWGERVLRREMELYFAGRDNVEHVVTN